MSRFQGSRAAGALAAFAALAAVTPLALAAGRAGPRLPSWSGYEGGPASMHYSPLEQIHTGNVRELQEAWRYDLADTGVSAEPLVLPDRLIVVGQGGDIVALHPRTGQELWRTSPGVNVRRARGFSYWRSADGREERVLFAGGGRLRALDPRTGALIGGFDVDLRIGLGRDPAKIRVDSPTPGRIFENLIIMGSVTGEDYGSAPGDVRAYDVRTGELVWTFHTIPRPGEDGHDTWPADAWTTAGGANVWGGLSVDVARGVAYLVTGSAVYDFYGADRLGDNLYANSVVAVDARTGRRLWHFQTVHHDLWDYDVTASPVLLTVRQGGRRVPAVAVAGKTGFLYVFDRVTGRPLWPIEERPVPASDVPGERASPTQPFPTRLPPFARQAFTEADLDPELPEDERRALIERMRNARNEGLFTPPSLRGTVQMPGNHGGANWGQLGGDARGRVYVLSYDLPAMLQLTTAPNPEALAAVARARGRGAAVYAANCQFCHGADLQGQPGTPGLLGVTSRLAPPQLRAVIQEGRATMPAFPGLDRLDLDALVAFLAAPDKGAGATPPAAPPAVSNGPVRYRSAYGFLTSRVGDGVIKPPWQTLTAYDLNGGRRLWQVPVGTARGRSEPTGKIGSKGGMAITAGGLVFVATEADRKLHAYDVRTGRALWAGSLPSRPRGGLAVYETGGRQYVVVPVGYAAGVNISEVPEAPEEKGRNAYVAFALPPGSEADREQSRRNP